MKIQSRSFAVEKKFKLICASILMLGASAVYAEPAFIITEGSCGMADGNYDFFYTSDVKQVNTNSANGNINLKCKAKGVPNDTGSVVTYDAVSTGFPCTTIGGIIALSTNDWEETVDADGNAILTCKFRMD